MSEIQWGLPVIGYLFLAGIGGGALTVSSSILLRGGAGGFGGAHFKMARYGALIAPVVLIIGTGLLILDLGTYEAAVEHGDWAKLFRFINLFKTINLSPMSIGSWALSVTILVSLGYAYTFLSRDAATDDEMRGLRRGLAWTGVPLGIVVGVYTGVLLGAMPSRPLWNSPVLALLFLISALSTGIAAILLLKALFGHADDTQAGEAKNPYFTLKDKSGYLLTASDLIFIGFEALVVFLFFMFAFLTIGAPKAAMDILLPGGDLATLFWVGFFVVGLVLPVLVELRYVLPTLLYRREYKIPLGIEIGVCALILIGGFVLRYVIVVAGQVTHPLGI